MGYIMWIWVAIEVGFAVFGIVSYIKEGSKGVDYLKFVSLLVLGLFVYLFAVEGMAEFLQEASSNLFHQFLEGNKAEGLSHGFIWTYGLLWYLYARKMNKKDKTK